MSVWEGVVAFDFIDRWCIYESTVDRTRNGRMSDMGTMSLNW